VLGESALEGTVMPEGSGPAPSVVPACWAIAKVGSKSKRAPYLQRDRFIHGLQKMEKPPNGG
jgi:hypothetical protein